MFNPERRFWQLFLKQQLKFIEQLIQHFFGCKLVQLVFQQFFELILELLEFVFEQQQFELYHVQLDIRLRQRQGAGMAWLPVIPGAERNCSVDRDHPGIRCV
jgi:hypothetical protein